MFGATGSDAIDNVLRAGASDVSSVGFWGNKEEIVRLSDCHLELDRLEEDEEGRAGVVLHVVVQTKRLQEKHQGRAC